MWSSTWSGTNSVRTLCHHLNWVVANNRGDIISQRYFEPYVPMNQILLKDMEDLLCANCSIPISFYCKLQVSFVLRVCYNRYFSQLEVSWCQPGSEWLTRMCAYMGWAFLLCQCQLYYETASVFLLLCNISLKAVMRLTKPGLRGDSCTFLMARWNRERLAWCLTSETYQVGCCGLMLTSQPYYAE